MKNNKLKELKKKIENTKITYDYEEVFSNLYEEVIEYMNETQDFDLEYLFEDFINYDTAEYIAKQELENGGLIRISYYINDTTFYGQEIFKLDGYGNLENIYKDDLEELKDEILNEINRKLEEENENK